MNVDELVGNMALSFAIGVICAILLPWPWWLLAVVIVAAVIAFTGGDR